jgi:hypothetical protein
MAIRYNTLHDNPLHDNPLHVDILSGIIYRHGKALTGPPALALRRVDSPDYLRNSVIELWDTDHGSLIDCWIISSMEDIYKFWKELEELIL